jgi:geranylgeranyl pyrophosphate synthase
MARIPSLNQPQTDFASQLTRWQARVDAALSGLLPSLEHHPVRLHEALRYSVLGPGKRIRPALVYATAASLGTEAGLVDGAACAVELIHAYSLVHDDLPAMDDDDLRRGRPTCHKAFDEATAILVGDSLQTLAFEVLARGSGLPPDASVRLRLVELLAQASGSYGMAGGQALDLAATGRRLDVPGLEMLHQRKTGALIRASVLMAAVCAGASDEVMQALQTFGTRLGLAFQIQDDLLDVEGDPLLLGKAVGADHALAKCTYPAVVGLETARARMLGLHREALDSLLVLGSTGAPLTALCDWLVLRKF